MQGLLYILSKIMLAGQLNSYDMIFLQFLKISYQPCEKVVEDENHKCDEMT